MLIFEIAAGVFIGGVALYAFTRSRGRQAADERSRECLEFAINTADPVVEEYFSTVKKSWSEALKSELSHIFDSQENGPITEAARIWEMASQKATDEKITIKEELKQLTKEQHSYAEREGMGIKFNDYLERKLNDGHRSCLNELMLIYANELLSVNDDDLPSITKGHPQKQFNLAQHLRKGVNMERDLVKSEKLMKAAAEKGHSEAQALLGTLYFCGQEVFVEDGYPQNHLEAFKWLTCAADNGNANAMNCLSTMYLEGQGTTQDIPKGIQLLTDAVNEQDPSAILKMGVLYAEGKYVELNRIKALMYMLIAEVGDHWIAKDQIDSVRLEMSDVEQFKAEQMAMALEHQVFGSLLRLSVRNLKDFRAAFKDPKAVAHWFDEHYINYLANRHLWAIQPNNELREKWGIKDDEMVRCKNEGITVAAMGIAGVIRNNSTPEYYSTFSQEMSELLSARILAEGYSVAEIRYDIDEMLKLLDDEHIVSFAMDRNYRMFAGNPNSNQLFDEVKFWDRSFNIAMAMLNSARLLLSSSMFLDEADQIILNNQ
jgi:TPR repeat protein